DMCHLLALQPPRVGIDNYTAGRAFRSKLGAAGDAARFLLLRQREVDLRGFEIDAGDLDPDPSRKLEHTTAALADQRMAWGVEVKIVAAELGAVDEPVDVESVERHEYSEARDAADRSGEYVADAVFHVVALEPLKHVGRR